MGGKRGLIPPQKHVQVIKGSTNCGVQTTGQIHPPHPPPGRWMGRGEGPKTHNYYNFLKYMYKFKGPPTHHIHKLYQKFKGGNKLGK